VKSSAGEASLSHTCKLASLLLGVLWGLWHLPLRIAMGYTPLGFIENVLFLTAYAVLFTWVYNNTKGSLFLMVLFHAVSDIFPVTILYSPGTTWIVPVLYDILLWVAVTMVVVMAGAARLSRSSNVAPAKNSDLLFENR
jgi:CAAX protease family protein